MVVDRLIKMIYYELVLVTIHSPGLAKVIINIEIKYYALANLTISNCDLVFTSKFWSSLCYFLGIKQKLSIILDSLVDDQTKRQNSTIKVYL